MTLSTDFLSGLDAVALSQLERMLELLGIKKLTPEEVVSYHIMPIFRSGEWKVHILTLMLPVADLANTKIMQKSRKLIETLTHGYSSEST